MSRNGVRRCIVGLTTNDSIWNGDSRCDRCDLLLEYSTWKGVQVIYSSSRNNRTGFYCVRCALKIPKNGKPRTTQEELDNFIMNLREKTTVMVQN